MTRYRNYYILILAIIKDKKFNLSYMMKLENITLSEVIQREGHIHKFFSYVGYQTHRKEINVQREQNLGLLYKIELPVAGRNDYSLILREQCRMWYSNNV